MYNEYLFSYVIKMQVNRAKLMDVGISRTCRPECVQNSTVWKPLQIPTKAFAFVKGLCKKYKYIQLTIFTQWN